MERKVYLGDSVYADVDGGGNLVLTTENGTSPSTSNIIVLEPCVVVALLAYIKSRSER